MGSKGFRHLESGLFQTFAESVRNALRRDERDNKIQYLRKLGHLQVTVSIRDKGVWLVEFGQHPHGQRKQLLVLVIDEPNDNIIGIRFPPLLSKTQDEDIDSVQSALRQVSSGSGTGSILAWAYQAARSGSVSIVSI